MSAIGGVFGLDGAKPSPDDLAVLGEQLRARGPDGLFSLTCGRLAMVYRPFYTTAEPCQPVQPLTSARGTVLTLDGRIDNRQDLQNKLETNNPSPPDAELVLSAYERWGACCFESIIGDYAAALWDPQTASIVLARDPIGTRTLYYCLGRQWFTWASRIRALLELSEVSCDVDDEFIAQYLMLRHELGRTPFRALQSVPAGCTVTLRSRHLAIQRFWSIDPRRDIRYRSDAEYEEHFREIFEESVRNRLRADRPVCAELSGGLDSSSIVCVSDELIRTRSCAAPELKTISYIHDGSSESDEREYISAVEEKTGRRGFHLWQQDDASALSSFPLDDLIDFPTPLSCFGLLPQHLQQIMQEAGARVLLRGEGGDHIVWGQFMIPPYELADFLRQGRFLQLFRRAGVWSEATRKAVVHLLWEGGVRPLLPAALLRPKLLSDRAAYLRRFLDADFVRRTSLTRTLWTSEVDRLRFPLQSRREHYETIDSLASAIASGFMHADFMPDSAIEIVYPFMDRRLIDFVLAIPFDQKARPGETRSLQRRALAGYLPNRITQRKGKGSPDPALYRALARKWENVQPLLRDSEMCERGYAHQPQYLQAFQPARHGLRTDTAALIRLISLELWLRALSKWNKERSKPWKAREPVLVQDRVRA